MTVIYDTTIHLKGTEKVALTETLVDKLDGMLSAYAIPHAFALPNTRVVDEDESELELLILDADLSKVTTAITLFAQVAMEATPEEVKRMLTKALNAC